MSQSDIDEQLERRAARVDPDTAGLFDDRGLHYADSEAFPETGGGSGVDGAILKGDTWTIGEAGTVNGVDLATGDQLRALTDDPGSDWSDWNLNQAAGGGGDFVPFDISALDSIAAANFLQTLFYGWDSNGTGSAGRVSYPTLKAALLVPQSASFGSLPGQGGGPPATTGTTYVVTDSTTQTFGDTITGGGAFTVLAWYNGTNWTVIGK